MISLRSSCRVAVWALMALGCQGAEHGSAHSAESDILHRDPAFRVTISDQTATSMQPAVLNVMFPLDKEPRGDLSWEIDEGLSLVVEAPYSVFREKELSLDLSEAVGINGVSTTLLMTGEVVSSGHLEASLTGDHMEGVVEEVGLRFRGQLFVSCAVPPDRVASNGSGVSNSDVLVGDSEFASEECATVKADWLEN